MATITVELGGVDRTTFVFELSGLSWSDQVNGMGTLPITFIDQVGGGATITPAEGQTVVIKEDGTARYSGILTDVHLTFEGPDAADQNGHYTGTVVGKEWIANKRRVWREYTDQTFEAIVADINTDFLSDEGLDGATKVEAGTTHTITFNGDTVAAAFDELCKREADGRTWQINVSDQIVMQVLATTATPVTLDKDNLLWEADGATAPDVFTDRQMYANVTSVVGGNPDLPIVATSTSTGEIDARIAAEGGSGRYEHVEEDNEIRNQETAQAKANAVYDQRSQLPQKFVGTTRVSGFAAGQQGDVNLPNLGLNSATLYVESVETFSALGNTELWHTVTMTDKTDPDGGWQAFWRNDKKKPRTIPMQVEAAPGIVRVESQSGALVHDPPREPGEWFQGQASGALDEGSLTAGIEHIVDASIGSGAFVVTLRRGGAAGTSGCGGGTFPGYLIGGAYCHPARQTIIEKWKIGADQLIGTSVFTGFSWDELAANGNFKDVLVVRPDNRYAAFVQYGSPGFFGVVSIAGEGFRGSCVSNLNASADPGEPVWVGEYVYFPNSSDAKIFIYHIPGTGTAPTEVGFFLTSLSNVTSLAASADGNTLYAVGTDGFAAMDIGTDPEKPGPQFNSGPLTIAVNSGAGTFTRSAGDFEVDGFAVGMSILGSGFTNGGNNTYFIISAISGAVITVTDSTGMVTEGGDGDEQLDAIEDSAVGPTDNYLSIGLNPAETALCAMTRVDAANLRTVTINVSGTALTLNDEKTHAVATGTMDGEGVMFFDDSAICFSERNPVGANVLDAHVFDLSDLSNVQYTEQLDYTHGANQNVGPFKTTIGRKAVYLFGGGATTQITFGIEVFDEVGHYEIDEKLRAPFGGTGQDEYIKGNILAATGRLSLSSIDPPDGDGWALIGDESAATGWTPKDISGGVADESYVQRSLVSGTFQETFDAVVTSDGATVTMSLEQSGGGDLSMQFSDGVRVLDCTPALTIALTAGSDTVPTENYIYILQSDAPAVLTKSTSHWPTAEHIRVAFFFVPSAAEVQIDGVFVNQNWNDHLAGTNGQGHLAHMSERSRLLGAIYHEGVNGNGTTEYVTIVTNVGTPDNVFVKTTAGVLYQLHSHAYPAMDTSGTDEILVPNHLATPYFETQDLADLLTDAAGVSMAGKYFNLILMGVVNKSGEFSPMLVNVPGGSYNKQSDAEQDVSGHDVFVIPGAFHVESSTGFLICRVTLKHSAASGGTWTHISTLDLRGMTPAVASGGSTGVTTTEFADNAFIIFDEADPTREIAFSADGITPGNTRLLTVPDGDGTLILATGLSGGQTLIGGTGAGENLTLVASSDGTPGAILASQEIAILGVAPGGIANKSAITIPNDTKIYARATTSALMNLLATDAANQAFFGEPTFRTLLRGSRIQIIATDVVRFDTAGKIFLNEVANANQTMGATRNQGGNDNQIDCLKSSDFATVLTTAPTANVETDDFCTTQKLTAAEGGTLIQSLCEDGGAATGSYAVHAYGATADTTKSTAGRALIEFYASEHDGANALVDVTAEGNVFGVRCRRGAADVSLMLVDEDAKMWLGGEIEIDGDLNHDGSNVGFYGTAPIAQPDVSGARDVPEEALADLIAELANLGLITDSTTAS